MAAVPLARSHSNDFVRDARPIQAHRSSSGRVSSLLPRSELAREQTMKHEQSSKHLALKLRANYGDHSASSARTNPGLASSAPSSSSSVSPSSLMDQGLAHLNSHPASSQFSTAESSSQHSTNPTRKCSAQTPVEEPDASDQKREEKEAISIRTRNEKDANMQPRSAADSCEDKKSKPSNTSTHSSFSGSSSQVLSPLPSFPVFDFVSNPSSNISLQNDELYDYSIEHMTAVSQTKAFAPARGFSFRFDTPGPNNNEFICIRLKVASGQTAEDGITSQDLCSWSSANLTKWLLNKAKIPAMYHSSFKVEAELDVVFLQS